MTIIISSANERVRARWKEVAETSRPRLLEAKDLDSLRQALSKGGPEVVLLHLSLPMLGGREGVMDLRLACPQARLLVFADQPDEVEGLLLLRAGVYGYCNTYMNPVLLERAIEAVQEGEVWVGWKLMQRLIKGLGAVEVPDYEPKEGVLAELTEREREIAQHIAAGASNKVIASNLGITERTVKAHLSTIFRKTNTRDRLQLALLVTNNRRHGVAEDEVGMPVLGSIKMSH